MFIGIEAKVLDLKGDIDADESFDHQVDLILGSIHRIPNREGFYSLSKGIVDTPEAIFAHWYTAFCRMIENPRVDVIAHPMAELRALRIQPTTFQKCNIVKQVKISNKILEINVRHEVPDEEMIELVCDSGIPVIVSSDSHSVHDLHRYSKKIAQLIQRDGLNTADIKQYIQRRPKI
jgi:putative hydrolase